MKQGSASLLTAAGLLSTGWFSHFPSTDLTVCVAGVITMDLLMETWSVFSFCVVMSRETASAEGCKDLQSSLLSSKAYSGEPLGRRLASP